MSCRHDLANGTCAFCYPDTGTVKEPYAFGANLEGPGAVPTSPEVAAYAAEIARLNMSLHESSRTVNILSRQLAAVGADRTDLHAVLDQTSLELAGTRKDLAERTAARDAAEANVVQLETQLREAVRSTDAVLAQRKAAEQNCDTLAAELTERTAERDAAWERVKELDVRVAHLTRGLPTLKAAVEERDAAREHATARADELVALHAQVVELVGVEDTARRACAERDRSGVRAMEAERHVTELQRQLRQAEAALAEYRTQAVARATEPPSAPPVEPAWRERLDRLLLAVTAAEWGGEIDPSHDGLRRERTACAAALLAAKGDLCPSK